MKNGLVKMAVTTVFCLAVAALVSSCGVAAVLLGINDVSGKIVDIRSAAGSDSLTKGSTSLWGATITLTDESDSKKHYSTTVTINGTFAFNDVDPATYRLTGSYSGWVIIPQQVNVTGTYNKIPDVLAYQSSGSSQVLIIVHWDNTDIDVDGQLVIDPSNYVPNVTSNPEIISASSIPPHKTSTNGTISLDRDIYFSNGVSLNGLPVETIRIISNPFGTGSGWLRYYLQSFSIKSTNSSTGTGALSGGPNTPRAKAVVYVMQGTENLGIYQLPINTYETIIGVLQIAVTYSAGTTSYSIASFGNTIYTGGVRSASPVIINPVPVDAVR